jgi:hypothetical protein
MGIISFFVQEVDKSDKRDKKTSKMKATKDFKLLSFGEEAEGDEETLAEVRASYFLQYRYFMADLCTVTVMYGNIDLVFTARGSLAWVRLAMPLE